MVDGGRIGPPVMNHEPSTMAPMVDRERRDGMDRVEQMPVYQLFFGLAIDVERTTRSLRADFQWLRIQVLKSSESVCANMVEGFYAQYSTEYLQALYRCRREARETVTHLRYAMAVGQMAEAVGSSLLARYDDGLRQLASLIGSIERKI